MESDLSKYRKKENNTINKINSQQKIIEELNKRVLFNQTNKEDIMKKITSLGSYSSKELEEHKEESYTEIMNHIKKVNSELQQYRHVNKKAFLQFQQFQSQRQNLRNRQDEIIKSEESITSLIAELDKKKEEAIMQSFSKVSEYFNEIYQLLEPGRRANIILKKEENEEKSESKIKNVVGIGIHIDGKHIEEMSGGEKTIVAISLIFAIQQMDPSPFYFFDEIDSDLDGFHRARLSNFINSMVNNQDNPDITTQFIYTTHHKELMEISDKFYSVQSDKNQGRVQDISFDEAKEYFTDNIV